RELDLELLKKLCILFGITRIEEYEFCRGETLKGYLQKNYDNDLYPVLKTTQVTPKLIQMQREVRIFLDKYIFSYNEQEREFMEDFYSENFRPNKLFNVEISNRLNEMYFYDEMLKMIKR
ncbi:MAG: hypothetical protein HN600_07295, partial [Bacteroidetes bacterium]|nr:hypothetical protein [Bacteroidota bacterium]